MFRRCNNSAESTTATAVVASTAKSARLLKPKTTGYPWRCLCRGLLQTTYTTPRRRTILHLSQIRLTLAFTFIARLDAAGLGA
jgi:hypothetical protein